MNMFLAHCRCFMLNQDHQPFHVHLENSNALIILFQRHFVTFFVIFSILTYDHMQTVLSFGFHELISNFQCKVM